MPVMGGTDSPNVLITFSNIMKFRLFTSWVHDEVIVDRMINVMKIIILVLMQFPNVQNLQAAIVSLQVIPSLL